MQLTIELESEYMSIYPDVINEWQYLKYLLEFEYYSWDTFSLDNSTTTNIYSLCIKFMHAYIFRAENDIFQKDHFIEQLENML